MYTHEISSILDADMLDILNNVVFELGYNEE